MHPIAVTLTRSRYRRSNRGLVLTIVAMLCTLAALHSAQAQQATLLGRVPDDKREQPIAGAHIELRELTLSTSDVIGFEFCTVSTTSLRYNMTGAENIGAQCGTAIFWIK